MTLNEVKLFMEKTVVCDGEEYILKGCLLFLNPSTHKFDYSAKIVSKKTNTVYWELLEKIEGKKNFYE